MPTPDYAQLAAASAGGLAAFIALAAAEAFRRARGTTLAAPAAWAVAAAAILAAVEATLALRGGSDAGFAASSARYMAAVGMLCPTAAVLGAKRPQDRGWQWVVLALWTVLCVPAGQAWAARAGNLQLSGPWKLMIASLIAMTMLNFGPTRHGVAALLAAAGQCALASQFLFELLPSHAAPWRLTGLMLVACAVALVFCRGSARTGNDMTRRWLAFRDAWGAFWGLRVLNRINETATLSKWPVRLRWAGFYFAEDERDCTGLDERFDAQLQQTMDSLLWRFERRAAASEE